MSYFHPRAKVAGNSPDEPVQTHVKLTVIDAEITVLGSGNMDRASWYTSQELGVAFFSDKFAALIRQELDALMMSRSRCVYDSSKSGQQTSIT